MSEYGIRARNAVFELIERFADFGIVKLENKNHSPLAFRFPVNSTPGLFQSSVIGIQQSDNGSVPTLIVFSPVHSVQNGKVSDEISYLDLLEMEDRMDLGENIQHRLQKVGKDDHLAIISREIVHRPALHELEASLVQHMKRVNDFRLAQKLKSVAKSRELHPNLKTPDFSPGQLIALARDFGVLSFRGEL